MPKFRAFFESKPKNRMCYVRFLLTGFFYIIYNNGVSE